MRVNGGGGYTKPKKHKKGITFAAATLHNLTKPSKRNPFMAHAKAYIKKDKNKNWGKTPYSSFGKKKVSSGDDHRSNSGSGSGSSRSGASGYSSGSSRKGGSGGKKKGSGKPKQNGRPPGLNRTEAANLVQSDINTQLLALYNQSKGQKAAKDYDISKANALFGRTKGDLDYLFNEAKDFGSAQSKKIDDRYAATGQTMADLFNTGQADLSSKTASRKAAAQAELERLGIQQSGTGSFDEDAANAANVATQNQANATTNLSAMREGANEVGALLQSMATGENASAVGKATNARNDTISQAQQQFNAFMQQQLGKSQEIRSTKFLKTNDLAQQLQQQRFTQYMQMRAAGMNPGVHGKKAKKRQKASQKKLVNSYRHTNAQGNNLDALLGKLH